MRYSVTREWEGKEAGKKRRTFYRQPARETFAALDGRSPLTLLL